MPWVQGRGRDGPVDPGTAAGTHPGGGAGRGGGGVRRARVRRGKVDRIAERAELTRGAVYSNFPGKRALYLAVLVDMVEGSAAGEVPRSSAAVGGRGAGGVRPGLAGTAAAGRRHPGGGHLQLRSLAGVVDDDPARTALAQVIGLEALLLALTLESGQARDTGRRQGAAGRAGADVAARRGPPGRAGARVRRSLRRGPRRASTWPGSTSPTPGTRRTCPMSPRRDRATTRGSRRRSCPICSSVAGPASTRTAWSRSWGPAG